MRQRSVSLLRRGGFSGRRVRILKGVFGSLLILVFWELASGAPLNLVSELMLPSPSTIVSEYWEFHSLINDHLRSTLITSAIGWIIAVSGGIFFGFVVSQSDRAQEALMPLLISGNSIPRVTLAPIFIFYIGGFSAKYIISAWVAFFPMFLNAFDGFNNMNEDYEHLLETFDANVWQEYRYVRVMHAIPFLFDGMKVATTLSVVGAVVGEFVAASEGIGYLAIHSLRLYNISLMFSVIAVTSFITVFAFFILYKLQDTLIYWRETSLLT